MRRAEMMIESDEYDSEIWVEETPEWHGMFRFTMEDLEFYSAALAILVLQNKVYAVPNTELESIRAGAILAEIKELTNEDHADSIPPGSQREEELRLSQIDYDVLVTAYLTYLAVTSTRGPQDRYESIQKRLEDQANFIFAVMRVIESDSVGNGAG